MTERRVRIDSTDARLGRHVEHDERSKNFALPVTVDRSAWHDKRIRIYDPTPNPNQVIGNCTGCSKANSLNAVGSRLTGRVLTMKDADALYSHATSVDPWPGTWEPDDTGSSGLAAAKAAQRYGVGGAYRWLFGGADEVVAAIMTGRVVSVGTYWYNDMFSNPWPEQKPISVGGGIAGGHQYTIRGYDVSTDMLIGRCWWGSYRDFWIRRESLQFLLDQQGDAHVQDSAPGKDVA